MLREDERDVQPEYKPDPCAVCGRPSGCAVWGFRLCYGPVDGSRVGCAARLSQLLPSEDEKAFTAKWVAENGARPAHLKSVRP